MSLATRVKDEPEDVSDHILVKEEAEVVDEDYEECVKEEPGCEDVDRCGAREAALASLYADHVVKDELVLGPELPHRPEGGHVVCEWALGDANGCPQAPGARGGAQLALRDCSVRLERLPHCEMKLHNNLLGTAGQENNPIIHADRHNDIEEELQGPATPELKSDAENKTQKTDNADKKECVCDIPAGARGGAKLALKDCSVRLERLSHLEAMLHHSLQGTVGQENNPTTRTNRHSDNEEELQGPAPPEHKYDAENKTHLTDNEDKKEYVCAICRKTFTSKSDLMKHIMIHIHMPASVDLDDNEYKVADHVTGECWRRESAPAATTSAPSSAEHETETRQKTNTDTLQHAAEADVYICDMCGFLFKRKDRLVRHIKVHLPVQSEALLNDTKLGVHRSHASRTPHCDICNKTFKKLGYMKIHKRIHSGEKPYSCKVCKKSFRHLGALKEHTRIHSNERSFSCEICNKSFAHFSTLNQHTRIHTGERPYSCEICKKRFRYLLSLKEHTRIHTDERPFSCEICQKSFRQLNTLKQHTRVHTDERPFACKICKNRFKQSGALKKHTRIHTDERPFGCEICKKRFGYLSTLKIHIRIHTDERPFGCETCNKRFRLFDTFKQHMRIHTGENPYSCDMCNKKFRRSGHLKRHRRTHTGEKPFFCGVCHKRYADSRALHSHRRSHIQDVFSITSQIV